MRVSMPDVADVSPSQSRELPLSSALGIRAARDAYLAENGFSTDEYTKDVVSIMAFGLTFPFPNGANRKWAIPLHDLHHVATGYGSDIVGEGEIGAWELGAGCRRPVTYVLNFVAMSLGMPFAPRRVIAAFRAGLRSRSLYRHPFDAVARGHEPLGALRAHLGIPSEGLAKSPRALHEGAPRQPVRFDHGAVQRRAG